jgi:Fe-S oxidoreductase
VPGPYVKSRDYAYICPSLHRYKFHAYSGSGKIITALSLLLGRVEVTEEMLDIVFKCQLCGACDINCHLNSELTQPLEILRELRIRLVGEGYLIPGHMVVIDHLRKEDTMLLEGEKSKRGDWAKDLDVKDLTKETADVVFHAGCRLSFDTELWPIARGAVTLLRNAGVDVGIMGGDETCCGGRAYEMGYQGELIKYAEHNIETWNSLGVSKVVVACSDGYATMMNLYPKVGKKMNFEVVHISEYLEQLIKEGRIKFSKEVPMRVTYHDPCHLGRLGEPYTPWDGVEKKFTLDIITQIPPRPARHGIWGIYEPPRNILRSIPGIELVEMERIREYTWCCGAGGGVKDAYPEFALWTAKERLNEANSTGAEALVTTCPWCERNFKDAVEETGDSIKVYDIIELMQQAI